MRPLHPRVQHSNANHPYVQRGLTMTQVEPTLLPITKAGRLSTKRLPGLTRDEARRLTRQIKDRGAMQWLQVERARDGKAHEAMGYDAWKDYAEKDLEMSESRTFQLLDTAKVMRAIAAGGANVIDADPVPARVVAKVKNHLADVTAATERAIAADLDIQEEIRALARTVSPAPARPAKSLHDRAPGEVSCPTCLGTGTLPEMTATLVSEWLVSKAAPPAAGKRTKPATASR